MIDLMINSSVTHTLLLIVPIICAGLLRWARCPGWAVLGGVVAGVLLGPTMLGRVLPDHYERLFEGGIEQRHALERLQSQQGAELIAADAAALPADSLAAIHARQDDDAQQARDALHHARWAHQRPLRSYTTLMIVLMLLSAAIATVRPETNPPEGGSVATPLSIGLWSSILPAALAFTALTWFWDRTATEALIAAAAVGIGPLALTAGDDEAADRAEIGGAALLSAAAHVASIIAITGFLVGALVERGAAGALAALPLIALPVGWMIAARLRPTGGDRPGALPRIARIALEAVLIPGTAACAALKLELFHHFALWIIVVMVIISGDGRWLGAAFGALILGGRSVLRTMRLVLGAMASGPTQLAVVAVAAHWWLIPPEVTYALVIGAVTIAVLAPARRAVARRIVEIEKETE